jgi:hypothetical protein
LDDVAEHVVATVAVDNDELVSTVLPSRICYVIDDSMQSAGANADGAGPSGVLM